MQRRKAIKTASESTFKAIANLWIEHWKEGKTPRHIAGTMRRLEANVFPTLDVLPIAEIQAPDVVTMVRAVEARGVRDVAKRALETTGQIFRYAIANGYSTRNPASEIKPRDILKPSPKKNYARIDAKDLPGLLRAIEVYQGTPITRLAIKLMAMTFVRTSELIGARWSEFDLEAKRECQSGFSCKHSHRVLLCARPYRFAGQMHIGFARGESYHISDASSHL
jgi:integrase